jgi:hypothetical protein
VSSRSTAARHLLLASNNRKHGPVGVCSNAARHRPLSS